MLRERYAEHWTNRTLARAVGRNRSQIEHEFSREFSTTIHEFLTVQRLTAARHLLATTTDKVQTIADAVGYKSKKAFYTAFERAVGVTPGEFRRDSLRRS